MELSQSDIEEVLDYQASMESSKSDEEEMLEHLQDRELSQSFADELIKGMLSSEEQAFLGELTALKRLIDAVDNLELVFGKEEFD